MNPLRTVLPVGLVFSLLLSSCGVLRTLGLYEPKPSPAEKIAEFEHDVLTKKLVFDLPPHTRIDTVRIDSARKTVEFLFNNPLSYVPYRNDNVKDIYRQVREYFTGYFDSLSFSIQTLNHPIERLIPNYYRSDTAQFDWSRMPIHRKERQRPVVENISRPFVPQKGLFNRNIGLWHSHGWYYNRQLDRWEWQRPRLFLMVEDLIPMSFTLPYLIPMLENAGARVFVPRERDPQTNEAIVDNDSRSSGYEESASGGFSWSDGQGPGFGVGTPPYGPGVNPFHQGTYRVIQADTLARGQASWVPDIPEKGHYAVYISYSSSDSSVSDAHYVVYHLGGRTRFLVNQRIGGGTWIYLGTFKFPRGRNAATGSVILSNVGREPGKLVSADGVRFGGGMGIIARNGRTSGRPKYVEGSRYYLQFSGMPDTLVYNLNADTMDYRDDYQSRAEYLNYLTGAPYGPNKKRDEKGLGIPIDLSLAFHTDAGITSNDTTIGTLSIYSLQDANKQEFFPDSISRLANRDLADLVQTQIVSDIRAKYDPAWQRRQLRNSDYSEAVRPNMPSVLLELLSHQNFLDMKFVLDPRFRFDVARAIYKAMVRFLATQYRDPYAIQPLPITHFVAELDGHGGVVLRWKPRLDAVEPTAAPDCYIVYTRRNDGDFDNGVLVDTSQAIVGNLQPGEIYSFKVTAVNEGGESFPSEILSVCWLPEVGRPVLIVNGFDRVSGPAVVRAGHFEGFLSSLDRGVPDRYELGFTGDQFDFSRTSTFRSNDGPGHGASFADNETKIIAGNTFDFPFLHGTSIKACGLSFSSASDEAIIDTMVNLANYPMVDLILGKEKETGWPKPMADSINGTEFKVFPPGMQALLRQYCDAGGNLFLSGSYIGTDLFRDSGQDSAGIKFARNTLRFVWATGHAARTGVVISVDSTFYPADRPIHFNVELGPDVYIVEAPDALVPVEGAKQVMRYVENLFGAGVAFKKEYGVVVMGFPFETVLGASARDDLMRAIIRFLGPQTN